MSSFVCASACMCVLRLSCVYSKKPSHFRERERERVQVCASMCVFAFERGFAMFEPTIVCVCVCKTERERDSVMGCKCVRTVCGCAALGFGSGFL